ncbi:RicAFT regulatory complex protein RicA family protein [Tuberibacillus calidus]|uniref:RicAFT regulatory complex protein RicA family protein n=1 Tax=Tuberibacillus calidus TaxID=340097 RepID=UPI0003F7B949|nr:YlbF family regulator [Tuberibacillus calidus]
MTVYTHDEILAKANELAKMLAETEEVAFFKKAEAQINKNEKVQKLIQDIKRLQKESVNLQHYQKFEALRENENKIDQLMDELDAIPLVKEFKQSQKEVNDLLQYISKTISERVTEAITKDQRVLEEK